MSRFGMATRTVSDYRNAMGQEGVDDGADDPMLKAVGARIRSLRQAAGIKQLDFARAAGMTTQFANRVEGGHQNLGLRSLARVAQALGTSMSDILDGVPADTVKPVSRRWVRREDQPPSEAKVKRPRGRPRKIAEP